MKTFADYLPTMTAREREIVEAYHLAVEVWNSEDDLDTEWPLSIMRSTPPAKEPWSVTGKYGFVGGYAAEVFVWDSPLQLKPGDRVRVVKIEEVQQ